MEKLNPMIVINNSSGTATMNQWMLPVRIEVVEHPDKIEMIYKETSNTTYTMYPPSPPETRVFKIVFSCVDGKWNKSERIYGEVIPPRGESYKF